MRLRLIISIKRYLDFDTNGQKRCEKAWPLCLPKQFVRRNIYCKSNPILVEHNEKPFYFTNKNQ